MKQERNVSAYKSIVYNILGMTNDEKEMYSRAKKAHVFKNGPVDKNKIQDHLGDGTNAFLMTVHQGNNGDGYNSHWGSGGGRTSYPSGTKSSWTLHFFGTTAMSCVENSAQPNHVITFNGASISPLAYFLKTSLRCIYTPT